jgi:hypothetical protein
MEWMKITIPIFLMMTNQQLAHCVGQGQILGSSWNRRRIFNFTNVLMRTVIINLLANLKHKHSYSQYRIDRAFRNGEIIY